MRQVIKVIFIFLIAISLISNCFRNAIAITSIEEYPPGPDRFVNIEEEYMQYTWWLARWSDNIVICEIGVDHEGLPLTWEIFNACGEDIFNLWSSTQVCEHVTSDADRCLGYYLHLQRGELAVRTIVQELPPPIVWLTLEGCTPFASSNRCGPDSSLVLRADEPLKVYRILKLEGFIDGVPFSCDSLCKIKLIPTDDDGIDIQFWAYSSYGDSSEVFTAKVRVKRNQDFEDPYLYIDVLSDQWRGPVQAPCMDIWSTFPPVGGLHGWLSTPGSSEELSSNIPYEILAGKLIENGIVDASSCLDKGLSKDRTVSACGMDLARDAVEDWQNMFDDVILSSANEIGVPAQMLKTIFGQESQFWPGLFSNHDEVGLGQLTRNGADTTFLWNLPFYEQFCSIYMESAICENGYSQLNEENKNYLKETLLRSVDAYCEGCPYGIDLEKAENSVTFFANTILANCAQAKMIVDLNYKNKNVSPSYEDLWRFTLVNYNAGSGCLGLALDQTSQRGEPLKWSFVSKNFTPACSNAVQYVENISYGIR